jgi:hypothetical protein
MTHRSLIAARTIAFTMLAAGALAALGGCTNNVVGGGTGAGSGDGNGGSGAGGSSGTGTDDSCTSMYAGFAHACALPGDPSGASSGIETCELDSQGNWGWSACEVPSPPPSSGSTPLVLSFDGAPVTFAATLGAFDLAATQSVVTDWPTASTPWLALDRDGNGAIDDGAELFGSATVLRSGERAANGFAALAELDSNGDGRITPEDVAWSSLRLWGDANGDRASSPAELSPLAARRILSIDLRYTSDARCDARDNCEIERASFHWADEAGAVHTGTIVDVHLRHQTPR